MFKRKPISNKKLKMALMIAVEALEHYAIDGGVSRVNAGHGDSQDAITFYYGLKHKPEDVVMKIAEAMK